MKHLFTTIALLLSLNTFAQTGKLNKDTSGLYTAPLYLLKKADGTIHPTKISVLACVDANHIQAMEIYKEQKYVDQYGDRAKNGVIIITLKQTDDIKTLARVLDIYKIARKHKNLPLFIDSNLTSNNPQALLSVNKLKSVKVATEKETGMKYLSIITDYVPVKPNPNEFRIRGNTTTGAIQQP